MIIKFRDIEGQDIYVLPHRITCIIIPSALKGQSNPVVVMDMINTKITHEVAQNLLVDLNKYDKSIS